MDLKRGSRRGGREEKESRERDREPESEGNEER